MVGLHAMLPLSGIVAERARGGSLDLGGSLGAVELNLTAFGSVIRDPIGVRDALDRGAAGGAGEHGARYAHGGR